MPSLIPFDFRCVGHLTGISLRCAPLQAYVPLHWPSQDDASCPRASPGPEDDAETATSAAAVDAVMQRSSAVESPAAMSPLSPDSFQTSSNSDGHREIPATKTRSSNHAPEHSHLHHNPRTVSSPRLVSLHDPSLCIEAYFALHAAPNNPGDEAARPPPSAERELASINPTGQRLDEGVLAYVSEVVRGSAHPSWSAIPLAALQPHAAKTLLDFTLFYTGPCIGAALALKETDGEASMNSSCDSDEAVPPTHLNVSPTEAPLAPVSAVAAQSSSGLRPTTTTTTLRSPKNTAQANQLVPDVCVYHCVFDLRETDFLGSTIEEADAALAHLLSLDAQHSFSSPPAAHINHASSTNVCARRLAQPVVYLLCRDGVFVPRCCWVHCAAAVRTVLDEWRRIQTHAFAAAPTAADFRGLSYTTVPTLDNVVAGRSPMAMQKAAAVEAANACTPLEWSRASASVGWHCPVATTVVSRAGQSTATMGDVKATALATLAWQHLAELTEARRAALARVLDEQTAEEARAQQIAVRRASVRAALSAAHEKLTLSSLAMEEMREAVAQRQRQLQRQEEAYATVVQHGQLVSSNATQQELLNEARTAETTRARLRAELTRTRLKRARELRLLYTLELSTQYANPASANPDTAKDHINKAALPILFSGRADADAAGHLVASTADAMHDEAVALGHASHLLLTLSILYNCILPYPILLGGGQSYVLTSPNADAAAALATPFSLVEARKYPLSAHRVAERPLMMAGLQLLLRDGVVLAQSMGKSERRIAGCADRMGKLLDLLLHDAD